MKAEIAVWHNNSRTIGKALVPGSNYIMSDLHYLPQFAISLRQLLV